MLGREGSKTEHSLQAARTVIVSGTAGKRMLAEKRRHFVAAKFTKLDCQLRYPA